MGNYNSLTRNFFYLGLLTALNGFNYFSNFKRDLFGKSRYLSRNFPINII